MVHGKRLAFLFLGQGWHVRGNRFGGGWKDGDKVAQLKVINMKEQEH